MIFFIKLETKNMSNNYGSLDQIQHLEIEKKDAIFVSKLKVELCRFSYGIGISVLIRNKYMKI